MICATKIIKFKIAFAYLSIYKKRIYKILSTVICVVCDSVAGGYSDNKLDNFPPKRIYFRKQIKTKFNNMANSAVRMRRRSKNRHALRDVLFKS